MDAKQSKIKLKIKKPIQDTVDKYNEKERLIEIISGAFRIYEDTGANSRSNKKVTYLHHNIAMMMEYTLNKFSSKDKYHVKTEQSIKSTNDTGTKNVIL